MDLLFQPQTVGKSKRMTPLLTFRSYSIPVVEEFLYSGICYIGRNSDHIARLTGIYNNAYSAEKPEHVRNELLRLKELERQEIPEIIICEASLGFESIRKFVNFLRADPALRLIPFVLEGSTLSDKELTAFKKSIRVDEILFIDACADRDLKQKFLFLRKVKTK